jgi:hypothetical protein
MLRLRSGSERLAARGTGDGTMKMRTMLSLLALAGATLSPFAANATGSDAASPTGKGIVGGALLGGELVMAGEAAFGVRPAWAYIVGGLAGGVGGGVGGYFVEQQNDARPPMLMLAGGLALAIPTLVAVLSATAYEPPANFLQDEPPTDEPIAEPPAPINAPAAPAAEPAPATTPPPAPPAEPSSRRQVESKRRLSLVLPPPALFGVLDSRLALGIPNIEVRHAYTRTERLLFNAPDVAEVRIPVLDVRF